MVYEFPDCLHGDELIYSSLILPYHLTTAHNFFEIILGTFNLYSETTFGLLKLNRITPTCIMSHEKNGISYSEKNFIVVKLLRSMM